MILKKLLKRLSPISLRLDRSKNRSNLITFFKFRDKILILKNFFMKIQLAIVGIVLIAGGIMFFPQTVEQLPEGSNIFSALLEDVMSLKEYNANTEQVGDTLYDVGIEVGDTLTDVAATVENSLDDMEISPNKILNLEG